MKLRDVIRKELGEQLNNIYMLAHVIAKTAIGTQELWDFVVYDRIETNKYETLKLFYKENFA